MVYRIGMSTTYRSVLRPTLVLSTLALGAALLLTQTAEAQAPSLMGGMTLLLGPPEATVQPVLGAPQDVPAPPQDPQVQPAQPPQTVYIVETQAPPGYGQPGYGQPGQTGVMGPSAQGSQDAQREEQGLIPRLILAPFVGYGVGVSLGALGLLIGAIAGGCFDLDGDFWDTKCAIGVVAGFYVGALLGIPLGVAMVGGWFNGMGSFGATFLGTLAGAGLAVLIAALVRNYEVVFTGALLPLAGAIIGYELSSASNARAGTATLALAPTLDRGVITGGTAGVRFAF